MMALRTYLHLRRLLRSSLPSVLCRVSERERERDMGVLKLNPKVPPALCLLLLLMPPLLLPPGCAAIRPDPTQWPSEGNRTCTEMSKRNPILYCEHRACADNCRIEGFAQGGACNWLRCLCNKPC